MKTATALAEITRRLQAAGIEDARREARILLAASLGLDAAGLLLRDEVPEAAFEPLLRRREDREPLAYILGAKEFWGMEFEVSPATLIPRPDTETLLEAALQAKAARQEVGRILDLGTGTGCLLLAALNEFPAAFGIGVDISPQAASLAARNARRLGLAHRSAFLAGDWAQALCGRFDLILANPPYIPAPDLAGLMPEVRRFEPGSALIAGPDGLDAYRAIIAALPGLLANGGVAILELGFRQAERVAALAGMAGFKAEKREDLGNIPRALLLRT